MNSTTNKDFEAFAVSIICSLLVGIHFGLGRHEQDLSPEDLRVDVSPQNRVCYRVHVYEAFNCRFYATHFLNRTQMEAEPLCGHDFHRFNIFALGLYRSPGSMSTN